jgi:hypothetical protein
LTTCESLSDETLKDWLTTPARNLVLFLSDETAIAGVTECALRAMSEIPILLSFIQNMLQESNVEIEGNIRRLINQSQSYAEFAETEVSDGMQRTSSHHAVAVWAAIETTIEHTLVNHVCQVPNAIDLILSHAPSLKPRNLRTARSDGAKLVIRAWESQLPQQETMERLLEMLRVFGLNITLEGSNSRILSEMAGLRDVILHNAGIADRKFLDRCPWRLDRVGGRVTVNRGTMSLYVDAAIDFAKKLLNAVLGSPYLQMANQGR